MGEVVSDLLLSAQLEHTRAPAETIDLSMLAAEVVSSLSAYARARSVSLVADVASDQAVLVAGVRTSVRRAILALVDNAIAHSPSDGEVRVTVASTPQSARLTVADHGPGVAADDLARITRRFARARSAETGGRRVGLGLALVTQILRSHDGQLLVEDTPGGGATFTLVFPALH